jgi:hypothetical protein
VACLFQAVGTENFPGVVRGGLVEHRVLNGDQELIVPATEATCQREISCLHHDPFPDHRPELLLGDPIFLAIVADNEGCLLDFHGISCLNTLLRP